MKIEINDNAAFAILVICGALVMIVLFLTGVK